MKITKNQRTDKKLRVIEEELRPRPTDKVVRVVAHSGDEEDEDHGVDDGEEEAPEQDLRLEPEVIRHKLKSNEIDGFKALEQEGADTVLPYGDNPDQDWVADEGKVKKQPVVLMLLVGAGLICVLGALLYFGSRQKDTFTVERSQREGSVGAYDDQVRDLQEALDDIERVVKAYSLADSWEKRLRYMRSSEDLMSKINQYEAAYDKTLEVREIESIRPLDIPESLGRLWVIPVLATDGRGASIVIQTARINGQWKVDWEASVGYQELDFEKLDEIEEGSRSRVRARFSRDRVYLAQFPEEEYLSLRVQFPEEELGFYGFVKRGSKQSSYIESLTSIPGNAGVRMMLLAEVEFKFKLTDRWVVELTQLINNNWVAPAELAAPAVPDVDFDGPLGP